MNKNLIENANLLKELVRINFRIRRLIPEEIFKI